MKKQALSIIAVLVLCMALGACKKEREVDVNKLKNIFVEGISKELAEDGNKLEVDTIFLNPVDNFSYSGKLLGHVGDTMSLVYDLSVKDSGDDDLDMEWELQTPVIKPAEEDGGE
jgi:hypothetical protein